MWWSEVREFFPEQFVLVKALRSHVEGDTFHVDEMAVIRPIPDPLEATRELLKCRNDTFVYHTGRPEMAMEMAMEMVMIPYVGMRSGSCENHVE